MPEGCKKRTFLAMSAMLLLVVVAVPASASERVALVIGNGAYDHAPPLHVAMNDAADVGAALGRLGFAVTGVDNADQGEVRRALREFAAAASSAQTAIMFYTGHAITLGEQSFLVPVDARLLSDQDIEFEAVPLKLVERAVSRASGVRLIILDAPQQSPFASTMQLNEATAQIRQGLVGIRPSEGTLVVYSAREGTETVDGEGRNSVYSGALLRYLEEPGLSVEQLFGTVREAVLAATGGRQAPSVYGSLSDESANLVATPAHPSEAPAAVTSAEDAGGAEELTAEKLAAEREFWTSVKDSNDPAELQSYLERYPNGTYAALARIRLARLGDSSGSTSPEASSAPADPRPDESQTETLDPEVAEAALGLEPGHRRLIQAGLALLGFEPGPVDGMFGQRTRAAIAEWQESQGDIPTGYLNLETAQILARKGNEAPPAGSHRETSRQEAMDILVEALQATGEIEDHLSRTHRLSQIGSVLARASDLDRAEQTIQLALTASQWIEDFSERADALAVIAETQAATGNGASAEQSFQSAIANARRIENQFMQAAMLAGIGGLQASAGDKDGATQSIQSAIANARRLADEFWQAQLFMQISKAQASNGDRSGAAQSFESAIEHASQNENTFTQGISLTEIAKEQVVTGDFQDALATAQRIESEQWRTEALAAIAHAQATAGDGDGAALTIRHALELVHSLDNAGLDVSAVALADIVAAQASIGDGDGAVQTIRHALTVAQRQENESSRSHYLSRIVQARALAGDVEGALATVQQITDEAWKGRALSAIAKAQTSSDNVQDALATARQITNSAWRARTLIAIAESQM